MSTQRNQSRAEFNARMALEALKGRNTVNELARTYGVPPTPMAHWQHRLHKEMSAIFSARRDRRERDQAARHAQLEQQIGPRKGAADGVKKKLDVSPEAKRAVLEAEPPQSSIARPGALRGLPRSTDDYCAAGARPEHLQLMRLLDAPYTQTPYDGVRRLPAWVRRRGAQGNHNRVARLLPAMGLETIYPKPRTSPPQPAHRVSPYLRRGVPLRRVNHGWSPDMTSIRLHSGFVYLVAVMEWCRRSVLSWAVAITLEVACCLEALARALGGAHPERFTSDPGAPFPSLDFPGRLEAAGRRMSRDGRGRALDNGCVERRWRTVQYAEGYLKGYDTPRQAPQEFARFFGRDNEQRQHPSRDYQTPAAVYFGRGVHRTLS